MCSVWLKSYYNQWSHSLRFSSLNSKFSVASWLTVAIMPCTDAPFDFKNIYVIYVYDCVCVNVYHMYAGVQRCQNAHPGGQVAPPGDELVESCSL